MTVAYLEKLALNMCTAPERVTEEEAKAVDTVTATIIQYPINELPESIAQNYLIVLIRTANAS